MFWNRHKLNKKEKEILTAEEMQESEITEHYVYKMLSEDVKYKHNEVILKKIADEEKKHYDFWKKISKKDVKANKYKLAKYYVLSHILGLTFGVKLMEKGEAKAQLTYSKLSKKVRGLKNVIKDEKKHENLLIQLINEERLKYIGSIVLGLNDAIVEFTGSLAGFTFALADSKLIALTGFIMGIAASLSMAASEYISTKTESHGKNPFISSVYTGIAYIITVTLLIMPFMFFENVFIALGCTVMTAVLVILAFTGYVSVAKDIDFRKRFIEMTALSLGIAGISFLIGYIIKVGLGINT